MPWLAPIGTPAASAPIESQVPSWQSSRAVEVARVRLDARQALASRLRPFSACASP